MRLRAHRRSLVVWSQSAGGADRYSAPRLTPTRRIRRFIRISALVTAIGLMRLARGVRLRWQPLLAGVVLSTVGIMLRSSLWGMVSMAGFWFLLYALLMQVSPDTGRRSALEHELAAYSTAIQRRDLQATLDRYPDSVTYELRTILANQAMAASNNGLPGAGRC